MSNLSSAPLPGKSAHDWDARYRLATQPLFGDAPNDYLQAVVSRPGFEVARALMLADGDGRNGSWLASRGIDVTAVDLSAQATQLAVERDRRLDVVAERIAADLYSWSPAPGAQFDLVGIIYLQGDTTLRRRTVELAAHALAPGGALVLEAFSKRQVEVPCMGPDDADKLYSLQELRDWMPGLELVEALAGQVLLDEGPRHRGLAEVVRVCARRAGAG